MPEQLKGVNIPPWLHLVLQLLATFCQTVLPTMPTIPAVWHPTIHAFVGVIQLAIGMTALYANPPEKKP